MRKATPRSILRLFGKIIAAGFLILFLLGATFFFAVSMGLFGELPSKRKLKQLENDTASEVFSSDSVLMGKYYLYDRTNVTFNQISPNVINALIATEDVRFYKHSGVDYRSLGRVIFKSLLLQEESSGGGSTISQQLAKNLFPRKRMGSLTIPVSKFKEILIARRLESVYSKEEIITLYLNTVPFGENAFGIESAAERFFGKDPDQLKLEEAAVLVGMLKATTTYNPRRNPERSLQRRNVVLSQMEKYEFLTPEEAAKAKELPLTLNFKKISQNEGMATYFREHLRPQLQHILQDVKKKDGTPYNLYTDGLKIYTTIDSKMQLYAEDAIGKHMAALQKNFNEHWKNRRPWEKNEKILTNAIFNSNRYKRLLEEEKSEEEIQADFKKPVMMKVFTWKGEEEKMMSPLDSVKHYLYFLNAGFMAMSPEDGHIKAWVGGINHKYFKYDHVNQRTKRQVGSTFKPIVYAAAIEEGFDPCEYVPNERKIYEEYENWSPANADGQYGGQYSMQGALTNSVNTVSVELLLKTEATKVIDLAHKMGIQSKIEPVPSIALGTPNISLFEMVGAYSTFVNEGYSVKPVYLLRIENKQGKVLKKYADRPERKRALSASTSELMVQMLKGVINNGTGAKLRYQYNLKNDIAGKTGTTQSHADGWFMAITPDLVCGVWVGADDPRIHFRTLSQGQGSAMALPIYGLFMQQVVKDPKFKTIAQSKFPTPSQRVLSKLDCEPFRIEEEKENKILEFFRNLGGKKDNDGVKESPRSRPNQNRAPKPRKKKKFSERLKDIFGK
ncbi:MAG: transglycosylase domain-containing protein [Bacteroidota bacterium]|nr:transglycosylase domain-containing protein [Bacteroidota bacterium]